MLNEIESGIIDIKYRHCGEMADDDYVFCYAGDHILLKKSEEAYEIPCKKDLAQNMETAVYLFSLNGRSCFGLRLASASHNTLEFLEIFALRNFPDTTLAWLGSVGFQLMNWYADNTYCGRCGSPTHLKEDERAVFCPACELISYPKISPAVIVAITCNNKILLAKGKNYKGDFYALIAGYVDVGESAEEAVAREVKEEIGLEVKNIRYYKSQPWPFSTSLMLGFTAEADDSQPLILEEKEIKEAAWFERGKLPPHASAISISGELINAFEAGIF